MQERIYALNHAPIPFYFSQNARDFIVREIPLYAFSNKGEHHILHVRKKGLSTQEMLKILSNVLGCRIQEFGYAGLKDKSATTTQYLSINKKFTKDLAIHLPVLKEQGIKILDETYHDNKIKLGHLKGNSFFIRLKKITPLLAMQLENAIQKIRTQGLPNYFGYQRFGKYQDNHKEGQKIAHKQKKYRNKTLQNFLLNSYQSELFNQWLCRRIKLAKIFAHFSTKEIPRALKLEGFDLEPQSIPLLKNQPHFFKILKGDVLEHYPFGRLFCTNLDENDVMRFFQKSLAPTGLLCGRGAFLAQDDARKIEELFIDDKMDCNSTRRYAWVWPEEVTYRFLEKEAWFEMGFYLPKGSYATIFLEELAHQEISIH
ncbi:tRNA pseudouridine(13) synthase TruD [Helicobacter mustelae]|uniref:tRNA pseudouridine synthase D n=1 Tax=Helicobacter mustelae (strain ATCC 43772 / CCUG 25715 / CIP 103759 / LMG 18044 / NCTC 12198 / R85-136P) TaxID=679897 RepID=D3UJ17_HELM1|nr:tRNA pseudouridine(13) synthase TruD [Helicobacter mustelae]CBG40492.1 putative tRNA pseudouridine synthase D, TruD [Helicobacter mustelae 12198]SQH71991.1 tRNA pseudouridine synthase D, TruD [Helicobacter mustelae]STP13134.1 tRNA pseudouridine synthase D, TruD [Helicobacter mustelae]